MIFRLVSLASATLAAVQAGGPATIRFDAGQTVTNLALVPLGPLGELEVVTSASTHFVVDILGVVQPQTTTDGELVRSMAPVTSAALR